MIKSAQIRNFESWLKVKLIFHEGVNVFVGLSDTGKSGLFRALRWPLRNAPSGDKFISDLSEAKGKATSSIISFDKNDFIARTKKGSTNAYEVNDMELAAFGVSVPEEVEKVSRMNDINIQRQIEPFFLLSKTAGERGKFFNKIAGIDKIDKATTYATAKIKIEKGKRVNAESEISRIEKELKQYKHLGKLEKKITKLRKLEDQVQEMELRANKIQRLILKRDTVLAELSEVNKVDFKDLKTKQEKAFSLIKKVEGVALELKQIERLVTKRNHVLDQLSEVRDLDFKDLKTKQEKAFELIKKSDQKQRELNRIKQLYEKRCGIREQLRSAEKQLVLRSNEFKRIRPNICPLCEGVWK